MTENELLFKALKTIKETCSKRNNCKECPLRDLDGCCGIQATPPEKWIIKEPPKPIEYYAFEN